MALEGLPVTRSYQQQAVLLLNGLLAGDYYYSAQAFGSWKLNNESGRSNATRAWLCRWGREV